MVNLAEMAFLSWQASEEMQHQRNVMLARNYHEGIQDTYLSPRLAEFLNVNGDHEFNLNVCRTVVNAVEERLILHGVDTTESEDAGDGRRAVAEWLADVWGANAMDMLYSHVHEGALRDGEYFVIVDWDVTRGRPRIIPHQRYVDPRVGGDGYGCKAHYPDGDTNQPMLFVSKRWIEKIDGGRARNRLTLYFPDRVEKYQKIGSDWVAYRDEGDEAWPIPWVDAHGEPLGIAATHFRSTPDLRPEAWDAIPLQRVINKGIIDLMGAGDLSAFQIYVALGFVPTADGQLPKPDGSNAATIAPASILGTTRSKAEADMKSLAGADLRPLIESIQAAIGWLAVITSTPEARLSFSRQIAAEGTLKEQNEGLFAKVRKRRVLFDAAWKSVFRMAKRLENTFGTVSLDDEAEIMMRWEPVQARDTQDERDEWLVKQKLGVPLEQIWREMGYSADEIEAMMQTDEYQARLALMQVGLDTGAG